MPHSLDNSYILDYIGAHVTADPDTGCRVFTGPRGGSSGYPTIMILGKDYLVVSLVLKALGRTKEWLNEFDLHHCHICDNPRCVNGDHIFMGTPEDNVHDAVVRGRHSSVRMAQRKTCVNGHVFDKANTWVYRGTRWCRACIRNRQRRNLGIPESRQIGSYKERSVHINEFKPSDLVDACREYGNKPDAAKALGMSTWTFYARWRAAGLPLDPKKQNRFKNRDRT